MEWTQQIEYSYHIPDAVVLNVRLYKGYKGCQGGMLEVGILGEQEYMFKREKENGRWGNLQIAESQIKFIRQYLSILKALPNKQIQKIINFADLESRI